MKSRERPSCAWQHTGEAIIESIQVVARFWCFLRSSTYFNSHLRCTFVIRNFFFFLLLYSGDAERALRLIESNVDPNGCNYDSRTPMHLVRNIMHGVARKYFGSKFGL